MIRVAVIDDEPLAAELIAGYLNKLEDMECIAVYNDPLIAFRELQGLKPDLIFIDVQMPGITGLQFARLADPSWKFIITTAFEEHAVESYEVDAIDYLLKPVSFERFQKACAKAKDRLDLRNAAQAELGVIEGKSLFVKSGFKTVRIDRDEISFLEGLGDYIAVHSGSGKLLTLQRFSDFESILPAEQFVRIHRSYLVNLNKIDFIERNRVVIGDHYLPISSSYKEEFLKRIG